MLKSRRLTRHQLDCPQHLASIDTDAVLHHVFACTSNADSLGCAFALCQWATYERNRQPQRRETYLTCRTCILLECWFQGNGNLGSEMFNSCTRQHAMIDHSKEENYQEMPEWYDKRVDPPQSLRQASSWELDMHLCSASIDIYNYQISLSGIRFLENKWNKWSFLRQLSKRACVHAWLKAVDACMDGSNQTISNLWQTIWHFQVHGGSMVQAMKFALAP